MTVSPSTKGFAVAAALAIGCGAPEAVRPSSRGAGTLLDNPRLPDVTLAGYDAGRSPPRLPVVADVRRFGAVGDGVTDDTRALQAAIDATHDGAVLLPRGRYVVRESLTIARSRVVLRGEGPGETVLVVPRSLSQVRPPSTDPETAFAYGGGFVEVHGKLEGAKLADVAAPARRGERRLALRTPVALRPGDLVRLRMAAAPALARQLLGGLEPGRQTALDFDHYVDWATPIAGVDGNVLRLARPLRVDVALDWQPEITAFQPTVEEVGVEGLSFEFPGVPKKPHGEEEGFNAIFFLGVYRGWVRDVVVTDADNAVFLAECRFCQVERVHLRTDKRSLPSGHHGIWVKESQDVLVTDFRIDTVFDHDLSVEGFANGNVFMRGSARSLSLDHHRNVPYENVFTDIDAGDGERLWHSGGDESRGPQSGVRETLWNIRHRGPLPPLPGALHFDRRVDAGWPELNLVRVDGYARTSAQDRVWIDPAPDAPPNLYEAERARASR